MSRIDDKLRGVPRLVRDGRVKEAAVLASDVLDTAAAENNHDLRNLSPDSLIVLRDLLDAIAGTNITPEKITLGINSEERQDVYVRFGRPGRITMSVTQHGVLVVHVYEGAVDNEEQEPLGAFVGRESGSKGWSF